MAVAGLRGYQGVFENSDVFRELGLQTLDGHQSCSQPGAFGFLSAETEE